MLKIPILSNGSESREMWSNGIKIAFFSKKFAQWLGVSPPDPYNHQQLGAPPRDPRLWYVGITVHFFT